MSCDYLRSAPIRRLTHPIEENPIWSILGSVISTIFAVAISLPFLLVFLLVLPVYLSVKWLLLFIYCNRQGSNTSGPESVRGNDSRWLGPEWRSSVIHAVLVFEAKEGVNVDHFRRLLLKRVIPLYPRLTQRLIFLPILAGVGNCWMTDAKFAIDEHVFPGPSFLSNEKDLQEYVSKLVADGLPEDKSPWQLQVFQSFGVNRDTVVILRVHQSVADGTALMRLLCHSLADSQIIEIPERPRSGSFAFCMNVFRACIVGPLTLLLWIFCSEEDCNLLTHRSSWTGSVTVTWSASITLPKVIRIKQVTRSTVNCVLLSALAGALRRLLQGCGVKQPPDVKVCVPMDLRDQIAGERVRTKLGNKTSSAIMPLPVAVEGCVPRLWATRKTLESLKTSVDPVILYVATAALVSIGSASFARHLVNFFTDKASLQFSSLPGPTSEILLEGQSLKGIYPILPAQANLGISITTITYADQVFVSVIAERALGPTAELILQYLEDQIEVLWKLLLNRRVPGEQESPTLYVKTNVYNPPGKEIDARFNLVQKDVDHYSEMRETEKSEKMNTLKAEFSELVSEIKRRQSFSEEEKEDILKKPRRRASSCSTCKKQNNSKSADAANAGLAKSSQRQNAPAGEIGQMKRPLKGMPDPGVHTLRLTAATTKDCIIDVADVASDSTFGQDRSTLKKTAKEATETNAKPEGDGLERKETEMNLNRKSRKSPLVSSGESSSSSSCDPTGPTESNCGVPYGNRFGMSTEMGQLFHSSCGSKADDRLEDSDESEIIGGVLI